MKIGNLVAVLRSRFVNSKRRVWVVENLVRGDLIGRVDGGGLEKPPSPDNSLF